MSVLVSISLGIAEVFMFGTLTSWTFFIIYWTGLDDRMPCCSCRGTAIFPRQNKLVFCSWFMFRAQMRRLGESTATCPFQIPGFEWHDNITGLDQYLAFVYSSRAGIKMDRI